MSPALHPRLRTPQIPLAAFHVLRCCGVFVLLGAFAATGSASHSEHTPDLFDELFRRLQPHVESFQTIRARFVETTTSTLLTQPLVARGVLTAARPSKLRLDYDAPERRTLIVNEHQLVLDWPSRGEHTSRDITQAQRRVQKYFVAKDPDQLRRHFDIRASIDSNMRGTWQIEMVPKRKQIQEGLTRLHIWVDQRTGFMKQMRMVFAGGDTKVFALEDVRLNEPVDMHLFESTHVR